MYNIDEQVNKNEIIANGLVVQDEDFGRLGNK